MHQPNLPKKKVASVHVAIICLLIILALIFSFLPIIKIRTNDANTASGIMNIVLKFGGNVRLEDLDEIKVSAPKMLSCVLVISDVIKVVKEGGGASAESKADLRERMESKQGKDTVLICAAVVYIITSPFKEQSKSGSYSLMNVIFNMLIAIVALLYLLGITLAMPIIFVILSVKALIPVIKNFSDLDLHTASVANKLPEKLSILMTVMLLQCVLPSVSYGSGTLGLFVITIICIFTNFTATRLTAYDKEDFIYLNIVQGASLLSIIGFFMFFFNVLDANIFSTFTHGSWGEYVARVIKGGSSANAPKGYILDAILILLYLAAVIPCVKSLPKCANRFSCALTVKPKKASLIIESVALLPVYIIPKIVAGRESRYLNPLDKSSGAIGSFLELSKDQRSALNVAFIGIVIMIASEIAFIVLDKVFCSEMSDEAKTAVLNNTCEAYAFEDLSTVIPPRRNADEPESSDEKENTESASESTEETEEMNVDAKDNSIEPDFLSEEACVKEDETATNEYPVEATVLQDSPDEEPYEESV